MNLTNYAESCEIILNQMPGYIALIDTNHKIAWANNRAILSFGFQSLDEVIGKGYADLKCPMNERTVLMEKNEKLLFSSRQKFSCLSYLQYADGCKLALCEKSPIINHQNELIGLMTYWSDITNYNLIDISRFLFDEEKKKFNKTFSYRLVDELFNSYQLSERQLECLFFLLRGKSDKEIAKILNLSSRTVESYIQEIKFKMHCTSRTQIIERSINEGLFNQLPKTLLSIVV